MAKSRAQRKAEKRRRQEAQQERQPGRPESERAEEERAQEDTQAPVSGDVAEVEAVMRTGAQTEDYGEHVNAQPSDPHAETQARAEAAEKRTPEAPAPFPRRRRPPRGRPGRPRVPRPAPRAPSAARPSRRRRSSASANASAPSPSSRPTSPRRRRNPVIAFFISCWAELKKVQWPDRDTLVQASAVTLIFVVVMAAFLGGLDAVFNWMIKQIL